MTKSQKIIDKVANVWLVLSGFLFCNDILLAFTYGSTPFYISAFFQLPLLFYFLIKNGHSAMCFFHRIHLSFYLFLGTILLSLIPGIIHFPSFNGMLPAFKGVVYYSLACLCPMLLGIATPKDKYKFLFGGLLMGFIANAVFSIIAAFFYYVFDYVLTLTKLFIQPSFWTPNYYFEAQGLFREPAHFAAFTMIAFYVLFWYYKSKKVRITLSLITWVGFLLYGGGNFIVFILSQIIFFIYLYGKKWWLLFKGKIYPSKVKFPIFIFVSLTSFIVIALLCFGPLKSGIQSLIYQANPFSDANTERFLSMRVGLEVALQNPFGVGFNLSGTWIEIHYSDILSTASTHNYLLQILDDQGFFGLLFFVAFYVIVAINVSRKNKQGFLLALSLISAVVIWFLNGTNFSYCYLITGVAISQARAPLVLRFWDEKAKRISENFEAIRRITI